MNTFIVAGELKSFLAVGWTLTIHRFPSVGFEKEECALGRLDFNHPPISIGGIQKEGKGITLSSRSRWIGVSKGRLSRYCDLYFLKYG